jgi:hypothetical protein
MSEWIRRKDADKNGINSCYTCGVRKHYKEMNAGHLYHNRLDLCADNLKCQCVKCNQYLSGNLAEYTLRLISEIGIENVEALKRRANLKGNSYTVFELEEIIQILQAKLKELAQN